MSEQAEPQFRATWAKFTVGTLKRWPNPARGRLLEAIDADLRAEIRGGSSLAWQPAHVFTDLCGQIAAQGDELARLFWQFSLRTSIDQPLIGTLVRGGMALWGATPAALCARTPRAWQLISRGCGEMRLEDGRHSSEMILHASGLPSVCRKHEGLLRMWEGGFHGQADFVGHKVSVETYSPNFQHTGKARFVVRWQ